MVPKNLRVTLKTMMDNIIMGLEFDPKEAVLHHAEGIDVIPSNKLLSSLAQFPYVNGGLFANEDIEIPQFMNITVRQSRQSGVARATCPD